MRNRRPVSDTSILPTKVGVGRCCGHHGEFLQGVFADDVHHLQRGLLTVPCPIYQSHANFWPRKTGPVTVRPAWRTKAVKAAELTLALIKEPSAGGDLTIESNIPPGAGFGSSTADVIAAIRAVADYANFSLPRATISEIAVAAEMASDSLAFVDQPVLFGHRSGVLIETFAGDYPRLTIVGFDTGDPPVATNEFAPARYSPEEIENFSVLRALAARAICSGDGPALGRVSSVSAVMNQRHLPISRFSDIVRFGRISGALGIQVAHSGNVAGFVFGAGERGQVDTGRRILNDEGFGNVIEFEVFSASGSSL